MYGHQKSYNYEQEIVQEFLSMNLALITGTVNQLSKKIKPDNQSSKHHS